MIGIEYSMVSPSTLLQTLTSLRAFTKPKITSKRTCQVHLLSLLAVSQPFPWCGRCLIHACFSHKAFQALSCWGRHNDTTPTASSHWPSSTLGPRHQMVINTVNHIPASQPSYPNLPMPIWTVLLSLLLLQSSKQRTFLSLMSSAESLRIACALTLVYH